MLMGRIGAVIAVGLLAVEAVVAGCGSAPSGPPPATVAPASITVVTTTDVYGSIARAVGGDRVTVKSIINSPDADPHEYEATPADAAAVAAARLMIFNGGGYDDFATKLLDVASTRPQVIDVVALSGLRPPGAQEFNEHVWYSLPTVEKLAYEIAADLATADPPGASTYAGNATTFATRVNGLIGRVDALNAAHHGEKVAVTEPVPLYLVQAAGLQNATPAAFSEAAEQGSDPSATVLNETLQLFANRTVKALLANTQTEGAATRQVEQAAGVAGVPVVVVTETLPAGVDDYVTWQSGQIDQLSAALGRAGA
jgi:zinc/manganese transport system substrate-binding protein